MINHFFANIIEILQNGATHGGYFFLFIISIIEAVPVVGTTVPGHTAVILSGFLSRIGLFNIWIVIALASFGAVMGDMIGFYLGKKYGITLLDKFKSRFPISENSIEKTKALINRHTGKALIIGRFNPVTRPLMPFIVGTGNARTHTFWLYNIIGGVLWASLSVLVGYVFGMGYHAVLGVAGKGIVVAIVSTVLIVWGYKFVNARFHIFRRYELFVLSLNLMSLWILISMMRDAWSRYPSMANFDIWVNVFMSENVSSLISSLAYFVSNIGGTMVMLALGIIIGITFVYRRKWRSGAIMLGSVLSAGLAVELLKSFFLRARPENALYLLNDPSFPSGHATMAMVFFVAFLYLFVPKIHSILKRELLITVVTISVLAIGISRAVLNVHWASDIIAGWALGLFIATATILLVKYLASVYFRVRTRQ